MSDILADRDLFTLCVEYGFLPAEYRYQNRLVDDQGIRVASFATGDRSTGILIKYDSDDINWPN